MSRDYLACPRCGIEREVHLYRDTARGLCRDCKTVEPNWPEISMPRARRPIALCGTEGGYYRHIRTIGEPACDTCKKAHNAAELDRARIRGVRPLSIWRSQERKRNQQGRFVA